MTYAKAPASSKGDKDSVGIEEFRDKYRLNLARKYSRALFGTDQKRFSTGLSVCPENLAAVEAKAQKMHLDLLAGHFDLTLARYEIANQQPKLTVVTAIAKASISILELYDLYCESRKGDVAETTLEIEFKGTFRRAIVEAINNVGDDALAIRNYLVAHRGSKLVRECLRHLSKAYRLGIKHKKVNDNPFDGMAEEIIIPKENRKTQDNFDDEEGDEDTRAFTVDEMNAIIEAYESSGHRRHYAPIIKFLFWTGCRTGEAVGFKWRDVKWNREVITIRRTYSHKLKIFKPTKTNTVRFIPMPKVGLLWNLLQSLPQGNLDDVVFPSKTGLVIDINRLGDTWRGRKNDNQKGVLPTLIEKGEVREYLKLYATRHTFISHQVNICKVPITTVAQWVGNNALVSNNVYLERDTIVLPGNPNAPKSIPVNNLPNQLVELLANLTSDQIDQLKALLS